MKKTVWLLVALGLLVMSCATGTPRTTDTPRPAERSAWWGSDPTCSPGCPPGQASGW